MQPATTSPDPISLETFRLLVEESLTGVYLIQDERLLYVNRRLAEIFGYTREEMLRLPSALEVIAASHRDLVREKLRQRIAGELAVVEVPRSAASAGMARPSTWTSAARARRTRERRRSLAACWTSAIARSSSGRCGICR